MFAELLELLGNLSSCGSGRGEERGCFLEFFPSFGNGKMYICNSWGGYYIHANVACMVGLIA
jgi:hypothetical protein